MIDKELEKTIREVEEERRQKEFIENINKKLDRLVSNQEEAELNEKAKEFKKTFLLKRERIKIHDFR